MVIKACIKYIMGKKSENSCKNQCTVYSFLEKYYGTIRKMDVWVGSYVSIF